MVWRIASQPANAQRSADARVPALHPCVLAPLCLGCLRFPTCTRCSLLSARLGPGEPATLQQRPPLMMLVCLPVAARVGLGSSLAVLVRATPCRMELRSATLCVLCWSQGPYACCAACTLPQRPRPPSLVAGVEAWRPVQGANRLLFCGCLSCCVLTDRDRTAVSVRKCMCACCDTCGVSVCVSTHVVCV